MQLTSLTDIPRAFGSQLAAMFAGTSYLLSGGAVTAQGAGSRQVNIAALTGWVNGVFVNYAGGNVTPAAPVANARKDLIVILAGQAVPSVVVGAEAGTPSPPALPAGALFLGEVFTPLGAADYTTGGYVNDYTMIDTFGQGSAANPAMTFTGDLTTGFFRAAAGVIGWSSAGVEGGRLGATFVQIGANPAASGMLRLPNAGTLVERNAANTADIEILRLNSSNNIVVDNAAASAIQILSTLAIGGGGTAFAGSGVVRLPNGQNMNFRNAANSGDRVLIGSDASNNIAIGDTNPVITLSGPTIKLPSGATLQFDGGGGGMPAIGDIRFNRGGAGVSLVARTNANNADLIILDVNQAVANQVRINDNNTVRPMNTAVSDGLGHLAANTRYWQAQ